VSERDLAQIIRTIVPYVIATLPQRGGDDIPGMDGWGKCHLGRAVSSARQLRALLEEAEELLERTE